MNEESIMTFEIRELTEMDRAWVKRVVEAEWGGSIVVSRGLVHEPGSLPGLIALYGDRPVGLVTFNIVDQSCELVTLNSFKEGIGIGASLVDSVVSKAKEEGCLRLWLITTNDNTRALRFYQKIGFRLIALHRGAVEESRKMKPTIPITGLDGIPIRDELELEIRFGIQRSET